jgi:hypothetical protein
MTARELAVALSAISTLAFAASAQAQNGYSLSDAAKSPINYSVANAKPQMKCADLRALSSTDITIVDARLIAAADLCLSIAGSAATSSRRSISR